jgi:hypothetical protein
MRGLALLIAIGICGCDREPEENAASPTQATPGEVIATPAARSEIPSVVPLPTDQAEADRMILAGYTPHGDHLHPPGMKKCPLVQGNEAVM